MNPLLPTTHGLILIVDDRKNWRETLEELLRADGHLVNTSASLEEAQILLAEKDFDVVVIDVRLLDERRYDIQGLKLLEEIQKAGRRARVIVMTGYAPPGMGLRVKQLGAEEFTFKSPPKGLNIVQFRETVWRLVRKAQALRA